MDAQGYIKAKIETDFPESAHVINDRLTSRLREIIEGEIPQEGKLNVRFQGLMESRGYPFLACVYTLKEAGVEDAEEYVRGIWEEWTATNPS